MVRRLVIVSVAALAAAGCSTITEGTTQDITVNTTPSGATCTLNRDGAPIGTVNRTPGVVTVDRSMSSILVTCHKGGFGESSYTDQADLAAATFSNIMTAGIGFAVDAVSGADTKYESSINIALERGADAGPAARPGAPPPPAIAAAPVAPAAPARLPSLASPATPAPPQIAAAPAAVPPPAVATAPVAPTARRVFGVGVVGLEPKQVAAMHPAPQHGVVVIVVQAGSPAARAGIIEGDILTSIGGRDIADKGDIQRVVSALPIGAAVQIHIFRGNQQLDLTAQL